jgi:uncharacterized protein (TIGR02271 family)
MSTFNTPQTTLVAAFDSDTKAQAAIQELERAGVKSDQIHVHSNRETQGTKQSVHEGGFTGWFKNLFGAEDEDRAYFDRAYQSGDTIIAVDTTDDRIETLADRLDRFDPVDLQESQPAAANTAGTANNESSAIPVVDENLAVGKRTYQRGGVRVYSRVVETPVQESVKLRDEQAYVTRTPVDRPAASGDIRSGEQVIEVQEFAEEPVVEKRARVVEEVKVGKNVSERTETVRDTVRHTEVEVESLDQGDSSLSQSTGATAPDSEFRRHFEQNYASAGGRYEDYGPAYSYGYTSAGDPQYRNRQFNEIEPDLRAGYERRHPNSSWEKIKNSVRYGWDRMTGKA